MSQLRSYFDRKLEKVQTNIINTVVEKLTEVINKDRFQSQLEANKTVKKMDVLKELMDDVQDKSVSSPLVQASMQSIRQPPMQSYKAPSSQPTCNTSGLSTRTSLLIALSVIITFLTYINIYFFDIQQYIHKSTL